MHPTQPTAPPPSRARSRHTRARKAAFARLDRTAIERILERVAWLDDPDQKLIEQVYRHGTSPADLARMTGQRPYRLHARLRRVVARLQRPLFEFVMYSHLRWPPHRRDIAARFFLRGQPIAVIAGSMNISTYRVRTEIAAVRVLAEQDETPTFRADYANHD